MTTNSNDTPGIIDFSEIIRQRAERAQAPDPSQPLSREELRRRLELAAEHGNQEVAKFRELVKTFAEETEKLVLFERVGDSITTALIDQALEQMILPVLANRKPYGMSDQLFKEIRRHMFKDLMEKYIK